MANIYGTNIGETLNGGTEDDSIFGFGGNDSLVGGLGNDTLEGGSGLDTMVGGLGNDVYYVSEATDLIIEAAGEGYDVAFTSSSYTLATAVSIEVLSGTGSTGLGLIGNEFNNQVLGTGGNDSIGGGTGNDSLYGFAGNDVFYVDTNDFVYGGSGVDTVELYLGAETNSLSIDFGSGITSNIFSLSNSYVTDIEAIYITFGSGNDTVWGTEGNDTFLGLGGSDFLVGAGGDDHLRGGLLADYINGGSGNDLLSGEEGGDIIVGGDGSDTLNGDESGFSDPASDWLFGGTGSDSIVYGAGDFVDGGDGIDTVSVRFASSSSARSLDFTSGLTAWFYASTGDFIINVEAVSIAMGDGNDTVWGSAYADTILGNIGADYLVGGLDNDSLLGGNGADSLLGSLGNDTLLGELGDDFLNGDDGDDSADGGEGNDAVYGSDGNDNLKGGTGDDALFGGVGNDTLEGNAGIDSLDGGMGDDVYLVDSITDVIFESAGGGTDVIVASVDFNMAVRWYIENLSGDAASTVGLRLSGNSNDNMITGTNIITSGDQLNGSTGNDTMSGLAGSDTYYVDSAQDVIIEAAGQGTYDIVWTSSSYTLAAGVEVESLAATLNTTQAFELNGNEFGQGITGSSGNDTLYGRGGADNLTGWGGNDLMFGGDGGDGLNALGGNDTLIGGSGADGLTGGDGADVFKFTTVADSLLTGRDTIWDFATGVDKLDFSGFLDPMGNALGQSFTIGTLQAGSGPRIQINPNSGDFYHHVLADYNGDGAADFEVLIRPFNSGGLPSAGDFIL